MGHGQRDLPLRALSRRSHHAGSSYARRLDSKRPYLLEASLTRGKIRVFLEKVGRLRFKRAVLPGERLDFLVSLTGKEGHLWKFKGKAQVGAEVAAEADWIFKVDVREVGFEL